jgi:hypothetical protein
LGVIRTDLVQDGPETGLWRRGRKGQGRSPQVNGDLGAEDGHDHFPDKPQGGDPGEKPCEQEQTADDLGGGDKMGGQFGQRETQFCKAAYSLIGVDKFQDAFPEKDSAGQEADP